VQVFFLGGAQSDFARNLAREGRELGDLVGEVVNATIADAQIALGDVDAIHVGNAFGELFTHQAQMGALAATWIPELDGIAAARHEGACASGSLAVLAAAAEIAAGQRDCVLVIGAEQERNVPGELAARHLGTAAWTGHEATTARYPWPAMFSELVDAITAHHGRGPTRAHLAAIAQKNFANARANPNAQTRTWTFGERAFTDDDDANPRVEGHVRRQDCGQVTDGVAAIVLASERFADAHRQRTGLRHARLSGWGHRTSALSLAEKLRRARATGAPHLLPHLRGAVTDAYARAGIEGPWDLAGFEVHDCFTVTEYLTLDHLGLTAPGEAWRAIEDGTTARGGRLPINPSGGLIGAGHPVGATGVRMALDACRQVLGRAGEAQVEGARRFGTLNIGGSATTVVATVWTS
jgi:acetyl-CoA C-acetyltransferase